MKPELVLKPNSYQYKSLLAAYENGKPLTCDQLNFLARHEKTLSSLSLDPLLKYYLQHGNKKPHHSFLLTQDEITPEVMQTFKKRISLLLKSSPNLNLTLTPEQFQQLREIAVPELILYHGNQFLTGAPFYPGVIVPILYFQWGNLFGVAKYQLLAEEKSLKSNLLIYIEDKEERLIEECIHDYQRDHALTFRPQPIMAPPHIAEEITPTQSMFHIPRLRLTLNPYGAKDSEE